MSKKLSNEELIENHFSATLNATSTLYNLKLFSHQLVIIFSAIDTFGLLDAPSNQTSATGSSFKEWAKKYIIPHQGITFTEEDLWGARCGILHTHTSDSDLAKKGKAKILVYITGDYTSDIAKQRAADIIAMPGGNHLPVHFDNIYQAFIASFAPFILDLKAKCTSDVAIEARLRNIIHTF
jgi:hypothetical protein